MIVISATPPIKGIRKASVALISLLTSVVLFAAVLTGISTLFGASAAQGQSNIVYTPRTDLTVANNFTRPLNAANFVRDGSHTFTCGDATGIDTSQLTSVSHSGMDCRFTIDPVDTYEGEATFTIPITSSGGGTINAEFTITVGPTSSIVLVENPAVKIRGGIRTTTIDAAHYASDGDYDISCTGYTTRHQGGAWTQRHSRDGCLITFQGQAQRNGSITLNVNYSSTGRATASNSIVLTRRSSNAVNDLGISTFSAPRDLTVAAGQSITIDASDYTSTQAAELSLYCRNPTNTDSKITVTRQACNYTITAVSTTGTARFTVPYFTSGGGTGNGVIPITIIRGDTITFTAPTGLAVNSSSSITIDASLYASILSSSFTISCGDAKDIDEKITITSRTGCSYVVAAGSSSGPASFTVPYTSSGGFTIDGEISIAVGSDITFTAPSPNPLIPASGSATLDASAWASDSSFSISCGDATDIDNKITNIQRTGCSFVVTAGSTRGEATFTVPYTSSGGDTHNGVVIINIGPVSNISFTPLTSMRVRQATNVMIDASHYASDGPYTIGCTSAGGVNLVNVTNRNGCIITINATTALGGSGAFTVTYSSSGGDTHTGRFTLIISNINSGLALTGTPPTSTAASGRSTTINARPYARNDQTDYAIFCGDATNIDEKLTSVTRSRCNYTVTAGAARGTVTFTVPYFDSSGATVSRALSVNIGAESNIEFTDPGTLAVDINRSVTFDASQYVTDGSYTISCGVAREESDQLASVIRNTCNYTVTASSVSGAATFTVPYRSSGGDTLDATFSVMVYRPPSAIAFREPFDLELGTNQTLTIDALSYASDGFYSLSCGDATDVDTSIITPTRPNPSSCSFLITPTGTQGVASFTVPYTSSGGASRNGVFTIEVGPASTISYTAPSGLMLGTNRTRTIDAASYVTDGGYVITCGTATGVDSKISITRANPSIASCEFTISPTGTQGAASFTVPYRSSGGDTEDGIINIEIGAASTIVYTPPTGLTMTASSTLTIDAATAVTDGSYTITCGQATNRDPKITRATNTGCSYQITVGADTGTATFTVPYTSAGGHTLDGQISITVTELPRNTAPTLDRQDMICAMVGMEPVRSSTADEITQGDNQAAFCQQNGELYCYKGANSAFIDTQLINIFGWDNSIKDCYNSIK